MPEHTRAHRHAAADGRASPGPLAGPETDAPAPPFAVAGLARRPDVAPDRLAGPGSAGARVVDVLRRATAAAGQQSDAGVIRRQLQSVKKWKRDSSRFGKSRSAALRKIDDALKAWESLPAEADRDTRRATLAALSQAIEEWKDTKTALLGDREDSCRLEDVEALETAVEDERLNLEDEVRDAIQTSELAETYNGVAVFTQAATVDNPGAFVGASADEYDAVRDQLAEEELPATEADVRITMLSSRVREAHQRMGEEIAKSGQSNVVGLFTAPEWYFKRPRRPFRKSDKEKIVNAFMELSSECLGMVIVPGSIVWAEGHGEDTTIRNTAVAVMNGHLLTSVNKRQDGGDVDGYSLNRDERARLPEELRSRAAANTRKTKGDWNRSGVTPESSLFTVANLTVSLEICADHNAERAFEDVMARPLGDRAHLQIIVSHSALPGASALRDGGIAVANDSTPQANRAPYRQVHHPPDPRPDDELGPVASRFQQGDTQNTIMHDEPDLAKQFMGIYQLTQ